MPLPPPTDKNAALRTTQIIAGALMMGIVIFGAAALFMTGGADEGRTMFLAPIAAGASLFALVVAIVPANIVPANTGASAPNAPASSPGDAASKELALVAAYQTRMIIRFALLEGAAMLNLVAAIVEKQPYSLLIPGLLVVIMAAMFPTRGRIEAFVKSQTEMNELTEMRDPRWGRN